MSGLTVALVGGAPPPLGGGGLERQIEWTAEALRARGHDVKHVSAMAADEPFDVLHAFSSGADVWQNLQHWRKHPAPLVSSPVIVCSPGAAERKLLLGAKLGKIPNINSMVRDIVRRSDHVVALTGYERKLVGKLAPDACISVIGNGVDLPAPSTLNPAGSEQPYIVMLGAVSERKGQRAVLEELGRDFHFVVIGGVEGGEAECTAWDAAVKSSGATWLGEIHDQSIVARVLTDAAALLLFSQAEVLSLSVLEALASGTPVVASDLPSHLELAVQWPGWVHPIKRISEAGPVLKRSIEGRPTTPAPVIPTWDDIAAELEPVYGALLAKTSS